MFYFTCTITNFLLKLISTVKIFTTFPFNFFINYFYLSYLTEILFFAIFDNHRNIKNKSHLKRILSVAVCLRQHNNGTTFSDVKHNNNQNNHHHPHPHIYVMFVVYYTYIENFQHKILCIKLQLSKTFYYIYTHREEYKYIT